MTSLLVSVVMPTFNAGPYVGAAVNSILSQTLSDLELIVVDDASTDNTVDVVSAIKDRRVRIERNSRNLGVAASLNRGLALAQGRYVARMDADDVSEAERLAQQFAFLESNLDIDVLGTQVWMLGTDGKSRQRMPTFPTSPELVRWRMLLVNSIAHPTVMARRGFFEAVGGYDPEFIAAEDYELWLRASGKHRMANLPQRLLHYRVHPTSTYATNASIGETSAARAAARTLSRASEGVSETVCRVLQNPTLVRRLDDTGGVATEAAQLLNHLVTWTDGWPMSPDERDAVIADARSTSAALFVAAVRTGLRPALSVHRVSRVFSWRSVAGRAWRVAASRLP